MSPDVPMMCVTGLCKTSVAAISFWRSRGCDDDDDESITMLRAIRVDSIVTGGYATVAIQEESLSQSKSKLSTSYLSSSSTTTLPASLGFNRVNEDGH